MGYDKIDAMLYAIERYIMDRHGVDAVRRAMYPLEWYINTGRASALFLRKLASAKPFVVGRVLVKGGADDEIIRKLCAKIGYSRAD